MVSLKQLRYAIAVTDCQFNISVAAEKLFISQPGISKQIKLLEEELNCSLFLRYGKSLQGLTEKGHAVIEQARIILAEHDNLLALAKHSSNPQEKIFTIATTTTQSAYVLPDVIQQYHQKHNTIKYRIIDGAMDQLIDIAQNREADCIILSGVNERLQRQWFPNMLMIPCFEWYQHLVCPKNSPIAKKTALSVADLAQYSIITYPSSKRQASAVTTLLAEHNHTANIFATANDPRTIKRYTAAGMGVGIIAPMAYNEDSDNALAAISLKGLLPKCTTIIAVERHTLLKPYVFDFIKCYAPHLSAKDIEKAANINSDIEPAHMNLPDQIGTWCI